MVDLRKLEVLVVDDDPALRMLLRTTFELIETSFTEVADAEAARTRILIDPPDVIVLDVGLPGLDGLSFARELKASPVTADIGIVLLTGHDLDADEACEAGVAGVIRKPFSPLELLAVVERAGGAPRIPLLSGAGEDALDDQLLLYADDVRRLLEIERRNRRTIERSYRETLGALAVALESRDSGTGQHSLRVQRYALALTRMIAPDMLDDPSVEFGYLLHDIGKVGIPDGILQKPAALTVDERRVMERHTTLGAEILAGVGLLESNGIAIVRHHHERWDGGGYPQGLAGAEIPLPARIFAVADALDAMTSDRPYRRAGAWESAVAELERGAGGQFEPDVVAAFRACEPELRRLAAA
jgi:putative nucleotidyltransferase with HDIG domain